MSDDKTKPVISITAKQKKFLKGLAHSLTPVVLIGKEGLSSGLTNTIIAELLNHELIKVKIGNTSGLEKISTSQIIAEQSQSALVQLIGKTIILYKPNPKRPKDKRIRLPKG